MRYCTKCTMPDTRPGITFDEQGAAAPKGKILPLYYTLFLAFRQDASKI